MANLQVLTLRSLSENPLLFSSQGGDFTNPNIILYFDLQSPSPTNVEVKYAVYLFDY